MAKILIVDDDHNYLETYKGLFSNEDFSVTYARNGLLGINAALADRPDLIIMDINMPVMDGFEAIELIRDNEVIKDTPILVMSEYKDTATYDEIYRVGANGHICRSLDDSKLLDRVEEMVNS